MISALVPVACVALLAACGGQSTADPAPTEPPVSAAPSSSTPITVDQSLDTVPTSDPGSVATSDPGSLRPVIERLPIDLALVSVGVTLDDKMMSAGPIVSMGSPSNGAGANLRPEITFQFLPLNTDVVAVSAGVVLEVDAQPDSCDSAIRVVNAGAGKGAAWTVEYDHVRDVQVEAGSAIAAGQRLGSVGSLFGCRDDGLGSVELQVNNNDAAVCAYVLMTDDTAVAIRAAVRELMVRWNTVRPATYLDAALSGAGCLTDELRP